ncbi:phosphoglycerate mutase family protein [Spirosoma validum]|uniref:Histidine phosphatase family protein n=1 Tax=Spirosoma validum TaxID=2771355 RepID=A0A927AX28_9BACT|nr:histidine phosphatase family protein [Spirosoma validum]MBD2751307.1 histidine phosphatase family protein [Spirosoma validum]
MKIRFIRHSKVVFKWKAIYDSSSFDLACVNYDSSPVQSGERVQSAEKIAYISSLKRSEETANALFHEGIEWVKTDLLNEIPLRSFVDTKLKLPTILWMIVGRVQWYLNASRQAETRKKTKERINSFLNHIEGKQQDCLVIGHGFYFWELITEMKKRKIMGDMKRRIKNEELREFTYSIIPNKAVDR